MSTRATIYVSDHLHLFDDCIAHDNTKDICLNADELTQGNYSAGTDGFVGYMDREDFAKMCTEYLKWYEREKAFAAKQQT